VEDLERLEDANIGVGSADEVITVGKSSMNCSSK